MEAQAFHRDREALHLGHYKIDCLSSAPSSVKDKSRRSVRHAGKAQLRNLIDEALVEYREDYVTAAS